MCLNADREHADQGRARDEHAQAVAEAVGEGRSARDADEPRVGSAHRAHAVPLETERRELRAAGQRLDELGRESAAGARVTSGRSPRKGRSRQRDGDPGEEQPGCEHEPRGREEERGEYTEAAPAISATSGGSSPRR